MSIQCNTLGNKKVYAMNSCNGVAKSQSVYVKWKKLDKKYNLHNSI